MKTRVQELCGLAETAFSSRSNVTSMWQEISDLFYSERGGFTTSNEISFETHAQNTNSAPWMFRRELGDTIGSMLRPPGKNWSKLDLMDERLTNEPQNRRGLDHLHGIFRRAIYSTRSNFSRIAKIADQDWAAFGNCVIEPRMNVTNDGLMFINHHLRNIAWSQNYDGNIDRSYLRWEPTARQLKSVRAFKGKIHQAVEELCDKAPDTVVNCKRIVLPADEYDSYGVTKEDRIRGAPKGQFVSIYVDMDNEAILEEVRIALFPYTIARWALPSPYAISPATYGAIPDARMLMRMTLTMIEGAERAVDPTLISTIDVVRGDIQSFPGGIIQIDRNYDERMGAAIRPLESNSGSLPFGLDMLQDLRDRLADMFYLNRINLPPIGEDMTALEVRERVSEFTRRAIPLFEPAETDYNGNLCELTFGVMMQAGFFGSMEDLPKELSGGEIKFTFDTPLRAADDRAKTVAFQEAAQVLSIAAQLDPAIAKSAVRLTPALRDALRGVQAPAEWIATDEEIAEAQETEAQAMQAMQAAQAVSTGAQVAGQVGEAAQSLQTAGIV